MAPLSTERGPTIASIPTTTTTNTTQTTDAATATTTTAIIRPARRYRGSFSTSICSLFTNPQRRTDCCALACCGLLSSDRTRYLILGERPPPWWRRALLNLGLPIVILILLATAQYYVPHDNDVDDDEEDNRTLRIVENILVLTFWICIACLIARGQQKRMEVREEMIRRLYRIDHPEEFHNEEDDGEMDYDDLDGTTVRLELYQRMQYYDTIQAHRLCCGCYANDMMLDGGEDGLEELEHERRVADLCTCLWNWLSKLCCGWLFGFWCLCCGMCAVGQEEREVDLDTLGVGKKERMVDYVTFEPYSNYYPAIESIRSNEKQSFVAHCRALSQLSIKLLRGIAVIIIFLALFALTDIDSNFTVQNMLVLLATFFQSFLVLHFVHWRYNKFDLSFDAVIKYFASGFILSTALAYIYELLVGTVFSIGVWFIFVIGTINKFDVEDGEEEPDPKEVAKQFAKDNVWLVIIYVFLNAFVVAALIEELCKYYGYWMVEHPDFMSEDELREGGIPQELMMRETDTDDGEEVKGSASAAVDALQSSSSDQTAAAENGTDPSSAPPKSNDRTLQSTGAAITVGMVSAALGFACCENLLYVFMYSPKSIKIEVYTLALRSMFPIHPLCAAIQSIGVCRRDLEGDTNLKLGRIIFVPLLIHGGFDFVIMLIETLDALKHIDDENKNNEDSIAETVETIELESELPSIIVGLVFVMIGILYYAVRATAQRKRLMAVDSDKRSVLGDSLVVC